MQLLSEGTLDSHFQELASLYREIYGYAPWEEYLACTVEGCDQTLGIREVFQLEGRKYVKLPWLEAQRPIDPASYECPRCTAGGRRSPMRLYYKPAKLLDDMKKEFSKRIGAAFLFDAMGGLLGFAYGWFTRVDSLWSEKLNAIFKGTLTQDSYMAQLNENLGPSILDSEVFYVAEWAISSPARNARNTMGIMQTLLQGVRAEKEPGADEDVSVFGYSLPGEAANNLLVGAGGRNVCASEASEISVTRISLQRALATIRDMSPMRFALLGREARRMRGSRDRA